MKTYHGHPPNLISPDPWRRVPHVDVGDDYMLLPRRPPERLSVFNWGSRGAGPRELAYCILMDCFDEDVAYDHSEQFKDEIIAHLPPTWTLTEAEIQDWYARAKSQA